MDRKLAFCPSTFASVETALIGGAVNWRSYSLNLNLSNLASIVLTLYHLHTL